MPVLDVVTAIAGIIMGLYGLFYAVFALLGLKPRKSDFERTKPVKRIAALDDALWPLSQWISAPDAPIITDRVDEGSRAADGASWFVSTVKNSQAVTKAVWMTSGLGVYDIFVNGRPVGEDDLKQKSHVRFPAFYPRLPHSP